MSAWQEWTRQPEELLLKWSAFSPSNLEISSKLLNSLQSFLGLMLMKSFLEFSSATSKQLYFFCSGKFVIRESATNLEFLRSLEISHVLNSAEGTKPGCVDTSQEFYQPRGVRYLGLKMFDVPQTNISKYFDEASNFIEEAVSSEGNKL